MEVLANNQKLLSVFRKPLTGLIFCFLAFAVLSMTQDFLRANLNRSGYYFSESFIFSSFWWLFPPLLAAQLIMGKRASANSFPIHSAIVASAVFIHLFSFPALVWCLSKTFYNHTFAFEQTFRYTLAENLYILVLFYSLPYLAYHFVSPLTKKKGEILVSPPESPESLFMNNLLIAEGHKKHCLAVADIIYFSANAPYIEIHLSDKSYLLSDTLKSTSAKLNPEQFVRVHKSTIININMTSHYTSRRNGDYDVTMNNQIKLRVSRHFATEFKRRFRQIHRLT